MFCAEIWKISEILSENYQFLVVKFSIQLNRHVFVMVFAGLLTPNPVLPLAPALVDCLNLHSRFCTQSTLVISKSKGLSEILRGIRISTYQICRIEEKRLIKQPHFTNEYVIWLLKIDIYWKYCGKEEQFLLFSTLFCYLLSKFHVKTGTRFSLWDKR